MLRTLAVACLLGGAAAEAQSFEVASIKRSAPASGDRQFTGVGTPGGGRLNTFGASLRMLITFAYNVKDYQISGGPGWANSEIYDIVAKADANAATPQLKVMLQTLLKERFKLMLRHETKDAPIYQLVVAKGGSKIKEDTTSARVTMGITGRGHAIGQKASIAMLVQTLGTLTGRPVVDKTGLASTYSFKMDWTPDPGEGGPPSMAGVAEVAPPPDPNGPSLFTALQEQLGLKLESAKGPVESLVIESAEKPSEN
jgi:uncharacterized protein (TIGR03435 family)